ncbi:Hpt domain-containing protein, partial [Pseudomonadota bacterium]
MMLSAERVDALISGLKEYISIALQTHHHQPETEEQDTLADVVTSIEYYFEALSEGRPGVDQGLQAGERALELLTEVVNQYGDVEAPVSEVDEDVLVALADDVGSMAVAEEVAEPEQFAEVEEIEELEVAEPESVVLAPETVPGMVAPVQHEEYEILADDADEEIVEIFIEEAVEVLGALHEHMPKWKADANDEESLTVVRRSFHTLKGSGRLIGAALIGEFSWKIENLLNRLIDKKIEITDELLSLMDEVMAVLPQLIEQLKGNREPIPNIYQLMAAAEALEEGRSIGSISAEAAAEEPQEEAVEESFIVPEIEMNLGIEEVMEVSGDIFDEDEMLLDAMGGMDAGDEITLEAPADTEEVLLEVTDEVSEE